MAQSHNENDTDRNLNCPGIRLDCGSLPKCYTTRNIMRHHLHFRSPMRYWAAVTAGAARCLIVAL